MTDHELYKNQLDNCPLAHVLNLTGGKWRLPIIWALSKNETLRYNALKHKIDGITNMMLTQSLKKLERHKLITRKQYLEIPPRVEYVLSDEGRVSIPALKALAVWGLAMRIRHG